MGTMQNYVEPRVAVFVDCDNTSPDILDYALKIASQFGRIVLRRGYGNHTTLAKTWQQALVEKAFTPCLQFQYAAGKNTSDIALGLDALEAMFDGRIDRFCLVTSDSDFAYLCRKLRERGATVSIIGEAKTPAALRNASDQFFEWAHEAGEPENQHDSKASPAVSAPREKTLVKRRPKFVVDAVALLAGQTPDGQVHLSALGQYLKRTDPAFSPDVYGYSGLVDMLKTYDLLVLTKAEGGHYTVQLGANDLVGMQPR
ncbi:NYN domain-containing protein [Massilia phyllosphaerae]|uniref:NYN domain-containing protein n=1 Tax=Massilia phyllosphaerae TaxID=3106034 RepID=UPI0035C88527